PPTESSSVPVPPAQPQAAPVIAQLNDGNGVLALDKEGNLSGADNLPATYKTLVTRALTTQKIGKSSQLEGLARPPSSLMSSDNPREQQVMKSRSTMRNSTSWLPVVASRTLRGPNRYHAGRFIHGR